MDLPFAWHGRHVFDLQCLSAEGDAPMK